MRDKGKAVAISNSDYYSSSSDLPCRKHPSSSSVGICAYCLKDRLIKLVCSDCGEQRLSSCSCSDDISSNVDIGSVGRISFLIENDKEDDLRQLKRSSSTSTSVENKKSTKFWRFGKLFRKKKGDEFESITNVVSASRSRSFSTGRPSDLTSIGHVETEKKENFILEDPGFIDLKLGLSSESKPEFSCFKGIDSLESDQSGFRAQSFDYSRGDGIGMFSNGSSCRITVNNNEMNKCRKSSRVWKWIVKHHSSSSSTAGSGRPSWKKDEQHDFKF